MQRNLNADILKSISIFGVVFIHASSIFGEFDIMLFFRDMFRFAVPCFIILWAFFFEKSYDKKSEEQRLKYIYYRFFHLFRVFLLWSLLYFFITVDWGSLNAKNLISKYFSGYGWAGQYFFIILFQFLLIYPLIRLIYHIKFLRELAIILVVIIYMVWGYYYDALPELLKKLGYRPFYFWLPYVFLGITLTKDKVNKVSLIFMFVPILIAVEFFVLEKLGLQHTDYITIGVLFSMMFCISLLKYPTIVISERLNYALGFIGRNTLIIFVSNPLVILLINKMLEVGVVNEKLNLLPMGIKLVLSFLMVILIFVGTLAIAKFLHKSTLIKILG